MVDEPELSTDMIVTVHQPQFLPYLGFFHKAKHSDLLVLLDDVQFQKNAFQNRNVIKSVVGKQWLTIPVLHHFGQLIRDVLAAQTSNWRKKLWSALQTNYGPAEGFRQLGEGLRAIFLDNDEARLLHVDVATLRWAMAALAIDVPIRLSSELTLPEGPNERLVEICRSVGATVYLSGPGGRGYMDLALFERAGIEVRFQDYAAREYEQRFPEQPFIPNLSVVDALFNLGSNARQLIA